MTAIHGDHIPPSNYEPSKPKTEGEQICARLQRGDMKPVGKAMAGHGGNFTATVEFNGTKHYLFLKPKDPVEALNYRVIGEVAPKLKEFMPRIYGEVEIDGKPYLVMQNTLKDDTGSPLEQLADIKLAGDTPGLKNPIARNAEMETTRSKRKSSFTYGQMKLGAMMAPGYMIASGSRLTRLFSYGRSKEILHQSLKGLTTDQLKSLNHQLLLIQKALSESPVAPIGASIILIKDNLGNVKPLLIDPAHMEVDKDKSENAENARNPLKDPPIFYSSDKNEKYDAQKDSNIKAISNLTRDIMVMKTAQETLAKKDSIPEAGRQRSYTYTRISSNDLESLTSSRTSSEDNSSIFSEESDTGSGEGI